MTGELCRPLSDELVAKMIGARLHNKAWQELRYFALAHYDVQIHSLSAAAAACVWLASLSRGSSNCSCLYRGVACHAMYERAMADIGLAQTHPATRFINTFYHMAQVCAGAVQPPLSHPLTLSFLSFRFLQGYDAAYAFFARGSCVVCVSVTVAFTLLCLSATTAMRGVRCTAQTCTRFSRWAGVSFFSLLSL